MKLYTMKCVKDPQLLPEECGGMLGQKELFVYLSDQWEEQNYYESAGGTQVSYAALQWWSGFMTASLERDVPDDEIHGYILPNEVVAIGETYTDADGLVWKRVN